MHNPLVWTETNSIDGVVFRAKCFGGGYCILYSKDDFTVIFDGKWTKNGILTLEAAKEMCQNYSNKKLTEYLEEAKEWVDKV